MPNLRINKGPLLTSIMVPASKSYANRALILASLKKDPVVITNVPEAEDVVHLISALKEVGLEITQSKNELIVNNSFPECEKDGGEVHVGEGGTTARFLATLLLLGLKKHHLRLGKRLKARPWNEFLLAAKDLGAKAVLNDDVLTLQGPIRHPSHLEVDCTRTTQFATGFDLIMPSTKVVPNNLSSSQSYWEMNAPLKEHLKNHNSYVVPADWSSAAFPMTFAALNHQIEFPGLKEDRLQADSKILYVLRELGAVKEDSTGIKVFPGPTTKEFELDMSDCLDLFPAMTFLLSHIRGTHVLKGLGNLVHKESNRLKEVCSLLDTFERNYLVSDDSLTLVGSRHICGEKTLSLPDDHRIVMTAVLFLRHHSGGKIDHSEAVNKSYPGFFETFKD